jgi:LysR family transcriptional regulator of abg operon
LHLLDGLSPPGLSLLKIGAVDFYVGSAPGVQNDKSLGSMQLAPNPLVIAGRPGHPLQHASQLADFVGAEWAFAGPEGFRGELIEAALAERTLPAPRSVTLCASFTTLLAVVSGSDALTLMPTRMFQRGPFTKVLVSIPIPELDLEMSAVRVVWKSANQLTPAAKEFINSLRQASR